ncbi:MAG: glutathione S-transferase family protein [Pseudomonadota bacterium]
MIKLFYTPASHFVRKCLVAIKELGIEDRFDIVPTVWAHNWGTDTTPYGDDFLDASPIARIPAILTEDGLRLSDSSTISEYLNDELGGYRLCPASGRERFEILSLASIASAGIMEAQVLRRAELLRKREGSPRPQEFSAHFVQKMMDRQDRCYAYLETRCASFGADVDLGQIAIACACATSDFRFPEDDWRCLAPRLAKWYDTFATRPSMVETRQGETPR